MAIFCLTLGAVYSRLFKVDINEYLPYLSVSFVVWGFIANTIGEMPNLFIDNGAYLKDIRINLLAIVFRAMARNVITFGHNLVIIVGIYLYFSIWPGMAALWVIPGFLLVFINLIVIGVSLSIVGARFRDIAPITQSIIQVVFFITPIMWFPRLVSADSWLIAANPFAHYLDLVRSPLLGHAPALASWAVSILTLVAAVGLAAWLYRNKGSRVVFWV